MKKYILFILISIILIACGPDESNKTNFSGSVYLIPNTDTVVSRAGVKVMLFPRVSLDSKYESIVSNNSGIGTGLTEESFFDHRFLDPAYQTVTSEDGSFSLSDVPKDTYNIVFEHDGYGFRYFIDYDLYSEKTLDDIVMHEVVDLYGLITEDVTLEANRFYTSVYGFSMDSNTKFSIEEGAMLQIKSGSNVRIKGEFSCLGTKSNPFRMLSTASTLFDEVNDFGEFVIDSLATVTGPIANGIISNSSLGFKVFSKQAAGFVVENLSFLNCNTALCVQESNNSIVRNCTFLSIDVRRSTAIYAQNNQNLTIEKNIIYNWNVGFDIKDSEAVLFENNYIDKIQYIGMKLHHVIGEVRHCEVYATLIPFEERDFEKGTAIFIRSGSDIEAEYNIFNGNSYSVCFKGYHYGDGASDGDFHKNDFITQYIFLYAQGSHFRPNNGSLDFTRNCFFTSDVDYISERIVDKNDLEVGSLFWQFSADVLWEPLHTSTDGVSTAGIRL